VIGFLLCSSHPTPLRSSHGFSARRGWHSGAAGGFRGRYGTDVMSCCQGQAGGPDGINYQRGREKKGSSWPEESFHRVL